MRVHELDPVYDVTVVDFKPSKLYDQAAPMARLAIHGFSPEMDRHGQILLVVDKLFSEYVDLSIRRMPRAAVKKLPPFYRMGAAEGIPKDATFLHQDFDDIRIQTTGLEYPREPLGAFILQTRIPGERRPIWNDPRFSKING